MRLRNFEAAERSPALFAALQRHLVGPGGQPVLKRQQDHIPVSGGRTEVLARLLEVLEAEEEVETDAASDDDSD